MEKGYVTYNLTTDICGVFINAMLINSYEEFLELKNKLIAEAEKSWRSNKNERTN